MGLSITKLLPFMDEAGGLKNTIHDHDFRSSPSDDDFLLLKFTLVDSKSNPDVPFEDRSVIKRYFFDRDYFKSEASSLSMLKLLIQQSFPLMSVESPDLVFVAETILDEIQRMSSQERLMNVYLWMGRLREKGTGDGEHLRCNIDRRRLNDEREYVRDFTKLSDALAERYRSVKSVVFMEVEEEEEEEEEEEGLEDEELFCSSCYEDLVDESEVIQTACCSHAFHRRCIDVWFRDYDFCPLCRSQLSTA